MRRKGPIRVLVVDDSALMRKLLVTILSRTDEIEVVGTALDGDFALRKIETLRPDVVTLDLEMPRMDGLTTLRHIVERYRLPVVVVSARTREGARDTLDALALGAVDFVGKPENVLSSAIETMSAELVRKLRVAAGVEVRAEGSLVPPRRPARAPSPAVAARGDAARSVVAVGVSTGGPNALSQLLPRIRPDLAAAVLVVQHMPEGFTAMLAERLDAVSALDVVEARDGDVVEAGKVYVAPGGSHLKVARIGDVPVVVLSKEPPRRGLRPSADVLFESVASVFGAEAVGVVLTGMGDDGAEGLRSLRKEGGIALAQDEATSVVFGMPRAAIERAGVDRVLPLEAIADYVNSLSFPLGACHEKSRAAGGEP